MKKITDIAVVIPSYNPDVKLVELVESLIENGFVKIILVNDGSAQENKVWFDEAVKLGMQSGACFLLEHLVNQGKGRALKTAFEFVMKNIDCLGVVTVDGDGQHLAKDIIACCNAMLGNLDKAVLGVRDFEEPHVPLRSRFGNIMTRMIFRLLCGLKISDTQTGLRAIPKKYLHQVANYAGERYEYETNMLLKMSQDKIEWMEVKISTVYLDNNERSHFHPLKDSWKIYKVILSSMRS